MKTSFICKTVTARYFDANLDIWLEINFSDRGLRSLDFSVPAVFEKRDSGVPLIQEVFHQLDAYFSGKLNRFDLPLDLSGFSSFRRRVWNCLQRIPFGETRSYQQIAREIGSPGASRAVGNANSRNPIPIIIPCHRVVRADGTLGGYSSGIEMKRLLLDHERGLYKPNPLRSSTMDIAPQP